MAVIFKNQQWKVEEAGMSTLDDAYWFPMDLLDISLLGRDDLYSWPIHMVDKVWVDFDSFEEAFEKALEIHAPNYDRKKLATTFAAARAKKEESRLFGERLDKIYPDRPWFAGYTAGELAKAGVQ